MKYLRICLQTKGGETLYEKDVDVRNVMDPFVRGLVSELVRAGTVIKGHHYVALVIPRYGEILEQRKAAITVDKIEARERLSWINLVYEEAARPDAPVRYFTFELRVRESGLIYRQDFHPHEVADQYVEFGVAQALLKLGQLKHGDLYITRFYARDDDKADFDRETMPVLQKQASSLVELLDEGTVAEPSFSLCDVARYGEVEIVGATDPGSIQIYVRRETMKLLVEEGKLSTSAERGGMLIGDVYDNAKGGPRIVEICDLTVSEHTRASIAELRYTFESWQTHQQIMRDKFLGKRVVGWYHTHLLSVPVHEDTASEHTEETGLFFSRDDVFLHRRFFPDKWYVAMVLDPQGGSIFFHWKNDDVVECKGYRIFEDVGVAGAKEAP